MGRPRFTSRSRGKKALPPFQVTPLPNPPVRRWWIFEGKRYKILDGSLAQNWQWVIRNAERLNATFNPRLQLSSPPDGEVDWGQTLARGPYRIHQEYVVRSPGIGLDENEHAALWGWMCWNAGEWDEYANRVGVESNVPWPNFAVDDPGPFTFEHLRPWAHTARRSRWPLLHGLVAESLRPFLEPEELDRIPLPSDRAKLFELLCLVRVASTIAPIPQELRWLSAEDNENTIELDGGRVYYQQSLDQEVVLATSEYAGSLAAAVKFFGVRIPKFVDLAFDFDKPQAGFDGIIIEAKSGDQRYTDAVGQLRTYRLARPRKSGSRYLIWGIAENPDRPEPSIHEFKDMFAAADRDTDVWVFSSAEAIATVVSALLGEMPQKEIRLGGGECACGFVKSRNPLLRH